MLLRELSYKTMGGVTTLTIQKGEPTLFVELYHDEVLIGRFPIEFVYDLIMGALKHSPPSKELTYLDGGRRYSEALQCSTEVWSKMDTMYDISFRSPED